MEKLFGGGFDAWSGIDHDLIKVTKINAAAEHMFEAYLNSRNVDDWRRYLVEFQPSPEVIAVAMQLSLEAFNTRKAKKAADIRHSKPGNSREKSMSIKRIWASGKYTSRDRCAEEECAALGMSYSSARKALRNTPDPERL